MMARRTYFYMLHLSIADITTAFLTLLPELIWTITAPNFYGGNLVCKTVKFMQMVGPYLRYWQDSELPRAYKSYTVFFLILMAI